MKFKHGSTFILIFALIVLTGAEDDNEQRIKRSPKPDWEVNPGANRDDDGNTNAGVQVKNHGNDHDFEAGWSKVVSGPDRAKPTWHVGGTWRFKRSPRPDWEVNPGANRDDDGNTNAGVQVKNHGNDHDFEAGWSKVVSGPDRAKPTWHVGGTWRFKRSPKPDWEVNPGANRDDDGNTNAGVQVKNHGNDHDFEAGWSKVVSGPDRAKPTWHVGGTWRFKRSPRPDWEVNPGANGDGNGNTNAGVEVRNKGKDHDFEAGWNKVVHGPNRAKPTWHVGGTWRFKRSPKPDWEVNPGANRDDDGNTNAGVQVKNHGNDHDFEAGWSKVVSGPDRAKPTWHVGGTWRFKRSPRPDWEVNPGANRDDDGNTNAGVQVKNHGNDHDFEAGWSKVVSGPDRAKPTWHVGGTWRFKRSPRPDWEVNPGANRDDDGNTNAGVQVKNHGNDHDFEAGWSKVVSGPDRAKPTWHVGGTWRFKRSPRPDWEVNPGANRNDDGNTNAGVQVKNHGNDHDFEAGWSKVVSGPDRAKPTWHVGGTWRFKRSPRPDWEVNPGANGDGNGNTNAGVEVRNKGKDHDFEAGWNKVVHGPNRAKPTWHVGGTWRFKRSPRPDWEVNPGANRDDDGNTNAGVQVKNHGNDHDFEAGWSKVVSGPDRAKPTWHVGGTWRF
ncbi:acaloleptin A-like isoform X4 [Diabrotica virgifera virgifera]|uniref:Acaloleptin A-like n=1 Tax=Diabrotica virgifera virgifera TaxID=50390 RepID=A0ABM5K2M7_DIAVI|nr:acaloleptin A-like isoform X4 [Diabrotica virgifera virgifera]